jgi:hypothetical protein
MKGALPGILLTALISLISSNSCPKPWIGSGRNSVITVRGTIDIPPGMSRLSPVAWEEKASRFLEKYFLDLYHKKALLQSSSPPTEYLKHVKGYITAGSNFWENVEITLDNIQVVDGRLSIQCTIGGQYVKLDTPYITDNAFEKSFELDKDYGHELNCLGLNIINEFNKFLKSEQCSKTH